MARRMAGDGRVTVSERRSTRPGAMGTRLRVAAAYRGGGGDGGSAAVLRLGRRLAESAAALLVEGLSTRRAEVSTKSTSTDMVTEMDRASERLIVSGIREARPHDGLLGEEGAARAGSSGVRWVIDPLDGTTNYV